MPPPQNKFATPGFVERGGLWVLAQALLFFGIAALGWFFPRTFSLPGTRIAALALSLAAATLSLAGAWTLGRNLTPFPSPSPNPTLVTSGIYSWIRHPLYVAVGLGGIGWGLWRSSGPALALTVVLGAFLLAKAHREERSLARQFPEYAAYAARVRRFIPGLW